MNLIYRYLVQCWVVPKHITNSDRDSYLKTFLKENLSHMLPNGGEINKALAHFAKENEGRVLEPFILESDKPVKDGEKDLLPEILKKYPEAKLAFWQEIQKRP